MTRKYSMHSNMHWMGVCSLYLTVPTSKHDKFVCVSSTHYVACIHAYKKNQFHSLVFCSCSQAFLHFGISISISLRTELVEFWPSDCCWLYWLQCTCMQLYTIHFFFYVEMFMNGLVAKFYLIENISGTIVHSQVYPHHGVPSQTCITLFACMAGAETIPNIVPATYHPVPASWLAWYCPN